MIKVDRHTVIQVLGDLMNKPNLLSDTDKYCLEPSDFINQLDKYVFSAIYNLYINGAERIHTVDIDNYLQSNPVAKDLIENENGLVFIQDCESNSETENFDYYYKKLKKHNLLRDIQKTGRDTSAIYCEDIFNPNQREINERFEQMTVTDVLNFVRNDFNVLEKKYLLNSFIEESRAYDGIEDLIKELKDSPEIGCKLQGDYFNTITRGGRKGKLYLRSAGSGVGKAVPNYTRIPTPKGWTTVGEVKVGDYLFDKNGKPTKVLAVYPQQEQKEIYKVHFKSGRVAECCSEHLWSYYSNKNDKNPNKLITTTLKELIDNPKGLQDNKGAYRWSVPICQPVQYSEKVYSVDPYVMGLILGDGSFRYSENQKGFFFTSTDEELVNAICSIMKYKLYKKNSIKNYNWSFELINQVNHKNVWVEDILKEYPELWNKKSEDKFIPQEYLFGSVQQRFDLLAGLLDTDGTIDKKGRISYSTVSSYLKDNIIELCESLGLTISVVEDKREQYITGICYTIHINASKENKLKMFKLSRKRKIAETYFNNGKRTERRDRDSIVKIEATNKYVDMTCFYVDNEEHLFLMNNFICTHNTRNMVGDACDIAYPIRYDSRYKRWVSTGSCEKVLYVMTEQDVDEIKTMILSHLTGYNEDMFLYGTYGEKEMPRIKKAVDIMEKYKDNMLFARIPDPCSAVVKNLFRRYNLQHGVENFFYDYIFSSPAMLNEYRDLKIREDVALRLFTTSLKNLAIELNVFVLSSTQLSNDDENKKGGFRDFRNIQGSRAIVNLVDFACIMSRPSPEELELVSGFKKAFSYEPNIVIDIFKNRRGRWNMVRIWSYVDLGTCRREDLFITNSMNKPVEDFQLYNFTSNDPMYKELEDFYNNGEVSDNIEQQFYTDEEEVKNIFENIEEAFGTEYDLKQRFKEADLEDML